MHRRSLSCSLTTTVCTSEPVPISISDVERNKHMRHFNVFDGGAIAVLIKSGVVFVFALAGCADMRWTHPTRGQSAFQQDQAQCGQLAYAALPPSPTQVMTRAGSQGITSTNCSGGGYSISCTSNTVGARPPTYTTVDASASARQSLIESCLRRLGYMRAHETQRGAQASGNRQNQNCESVRETNGDIRFVCR